MKKNMSSRVLSVLLVCAMLFSMVMPAGAVSVAENATVESVSFKKVNGSGLDKAHAVDVDVAEKVEYGLNDIVRVSIVMDKAATLSAGYPSENVAANAAAISYRDSLKKNQDAVAAKIEKATGEHLDVVWNMTLAANIISANVKFGQIAQIEKVAGVKEVFVENRYEPDTSVETADPEMLASSSMIGSNQVWDLGYTGAGSKVAVIDTGIDFEHKSFAEAPYNYSMGLLATAAGKSLEEYKASVGVLTKAGVDAVASQLNAQSGKVDTTQTYISDKIPFAYNYVDKNYTVDHVHDTQGEHGSHVEGISAANRFVDDGNGGFAPALEAVQAQGVAPDAQIVTMKVFGAGGGAYDSDYMVAIEDAIVLGCDSANLSLGSGNPGFANAGTYQAIMESLTSRSTVVAMSAGNSSYWNSTPYGSMPALNYKDDISFAMNGSPGSFTNSLGVASVDNIGKPLKFGELDVYYTESTYTNPPIATTIPGTNPFVLIDTVAVDGSGNSLLDPFADLFKDKVVMVYRGTSSFYQKMDATAALGAKACIIVNNQDGTINMDLSSATSHIPCISITQKAGEKIKAMNERKELNGTAYWEGEFVVSQTYVKPQYYTMSSFSSWGVPGALTMKPEISAPGGNIWSVYGANNDSGMKDHDQYESMSGTSMASPQVAGMAAIIGQYVRENGLVAKTGKTARQLANSLLMSTAVPMVEDYDEYGTGYYPVIRQGSGLGNVGNAVNAKSYIWMDADSTASYADGKVKAELGDDPARTGVYSWGFSINSMSDTAITYTPSTDLFTQDLTSDGTHIYMNTWTAPLGATVTYTVDGAEVTEITVPAGGKVDVKVTATLAEASTEEAYGKDLLDYYYEGGAYVEGYTYLKPSANSEGVALDVEHSIPVLGVYGSWTDASMYDNTSIIDVTYGTNDKVSYTGNTQTNGLYVRYGSSTVNEWLLGNPYMTEDSFPADRLAVGNSVNLYQFRYNLIRNAAALVGAVTNAEGKVIAIGTITNRANAAYYYTNGGSWQGRTTQGYTFNKSVSSLGVKEGDKITFGLYAIPEYYCNPATGLLTADEAKAVIESGVLGDGASISYTAVVDNTAPEVKAVYKDLLSDNLIVTAQDDNYIAAIAVTNGAGTTYASGLPEQTAPNQVTTTEVDLNGVRLGNKTYIVVADYAGNESTYEIAVSSKPVSDAGKMIGYTANANLGAGWKELDPTTLAYTSASNYTGIEGFSSSPVGVLAAEYVDGYVFIAGNDNALYATTLGELNAPKKVGNLSETIYNLAYNTTDKTLYALTAGNKISTVDLTNAALTEVTTLKISTSNELKVMTIDDDGNFYAISGGSNSTGSAGARLFKFVPTEAVKADVNKDGTTNYADVQAILDNVAGSTAEIDTAAADVDGDGKITSADAKALIALCDASAATLTPVVNTSLGAAVYGGSLAWDHNTGILYLANNQGSANNPATGSNNNKLWIVNTSTAKATAVGSGTTGGRTYGAIYGLFIVPSSSSVVKPATAATAVEVSASSLSLLKGQSATLSATVYPWNLEDKSVTWTSSDPAVVTVDENGTVTCVAAGEAVVTAASTVTPSVTASCTVTVAEPPVAKLSGLIYAEDGTPNWSDFSTDAPEAAVAQAQGLPFRSGVLVGDTIYTVDTDTMYAVDADTYEITSLGGIASDWIYPDAAPIPKSVQAGFGGKLAAPCYGGTYLEILDPEAGSLSYWSAIATYYADDPMAVIAFKEGPVDYTYQGTTYNDGCVYYVLTEGGELWQFTIFGGGSLIRSDLGNTGIKLEGVAANADAYASMLYDNASGWLYISAYTEGETAQMYALNPAELTQNTVTGTFGDKVWPAVSLYQYTKVTELTLAVDPEAISMFEGGTATITAKVKPAKYNGGVTFTSDNEAVATVTADGVVTGLTVGSANITVTTVDVDDNGAPKSVVVPVTVQGKVAVNAKVHGLLEGTTGAEINLSDMSTTPDGMTTAAAFDAGGMVGGALYGNYAGYACVDKDISGFNFTDTNYIPLDIANFPAFNGTGAFTNSLFYPSTTNYMVKFDFDAGKISYWNLSTAGMNLCAIAYAGSFTDSDGVNHVYYALGMDGTLYIMYVYEATSSTADTPNLTMSRRPITNIGLTFTDATAVSMSYYWDGTEDGVEGIAILDGTTMNMYWVEPKDGATAAVTGSVPGTYACALYNPAFDSATSFGASARVVNGKSTETKQAVMGMSVEALTSETVSVAPANKTVGGLDRSFRPVAGLTAASGTAANGTVSVSVTESVPVTNGKITVTYDPAVLTYTGTTNAAAYASVNASVPGTVVVAYAGTNAINVGTAIAALNFTYTGEYVKTNVTVTTQERNNDLAMAEETVIAVTAEDNGHAYAVTESKDATCTEAGYVTYVCSKCGDTYTDVIPALGHDLTYVTTEPTCTEGGDITLACSRCDYKLVRELPANGHDYGDGVITVAPTCTTQGVKTFECKVCGDISKVEIIAPLGHDYETWKVTKAPTCTETGIETMACTRCDANLTRTVPATGHAYGEGVVTKAPTCTETGVMTYTCTTCGETKTEVIAAAGHKYENKIVAPTCTETGYTEHTCSVCGNTYRDSTKAPTGHTADNGTVTTAPTCTSAGIKTYKCADCGTIVKVEAVAPLGHAYGEWKVTRAATCTNAGEETMTCTRCDAKQTRATAAIGHNYDAGKVTKAATCTATGVKTYTCKNCQNTKVETIEATGHDETIVVVAPTCTEAGYAEHTCKTCGNTYRDNVKAATGHKSDNGTVTKAATCTEAGEKTYKCTTCGETLKVEAVAATGHKWGEWTVTVKADCQNTGVETRTCSVCKATETRETAKTLDDCASKAYTDVDANRWYHAGVDYVVGNGIMKGTDETTFSPDTVMTRAQMVTVLYRMAGSPEVTGTSKFSDVSSTAYYGPAVIWANENGIVTGTSDSKFDPNGAITREQLVAIMYRYAKFAGQDVTTDGDVSMFADAGSIGSYAVDAMAWAAANGIVNGVDGSMAAPKSTATRAQVATILMRYLSK